jgi:hypothetical protein
MSNGRESQGTVTPFSLAMVLCDFIYRDPYTAKYSLIGTFSTVAGREFPFVLPGLMVYVALTGGRGVMPLKLVMTSADDDSEIQVADGDVDCGSDPRAIHEAGIVLTPVVLPKAGEYRITLYLNNEFVVERRMLAFIPEEQAHDN